MVEWLLRLIAFRLQHNADGGENIAIVVNQCNDRHALLAHLQCPFLSGGKWTLVAMTGRSFTRSIDRAAPDNVTDGHSR
jgi:hypothetical protein